MVSGWKYVHGQWMEICTWSVDEIMYMVSGRKYVNFASPMIMLYFNTYNITPCICFKLKHTMVYHMYFGTSGSNCVLNEGNTNYRVTYSNNNPCVQIAK